MTESCTMTGKMGLLSLDISPPTVTEAAGGLLIHRSMKNEQVPLMTSLPSNNKKEAIRFTLPTTAKLSQIRTKASFMALQKLLPLHATMMYAALLK